MEAEKQLSDKKVYQEVSKIFSSLKKKGYITEKQLKYFSYENRKATNVGKLYFFPKIHKSLHNVPRQPVISNCSTVIEKC